MWLETSLPWRCGADAVGQDAVQGAAACSSHCRIAVDVVPDLPHRLHEGPRTTAFPVKIVAQELPWPFVEQRLRKVVLGLQAGAARVLSAFVNHVAAPVVLELIEHPFLTDGQTGPVSW